MRKQDQQVRFSLKEKKKIQRVLNQFRLRLQDVAISNGHTTRFSDSSLYDEVCTNCGATDARDGGLDQLCPNRSHRSVYDTLHKLETMFGLRKDV